MRDEARTTRPPGATGTGWWWSVAVAVIAALVLASCAADGNTATDIPGADGDVAGFWLGLWHGIIVPITFIISLFTDTVGVYEIHNNGGWYNFGFLFGASMALGGGGAGAGWRR